MILDAVDPDTGLPLVKETRRVRVLRPGKNECTCPGNRCHWYPLPRQPFSTIIHAVQGEGTPWYPNYQEWSKGKPSRLRCWKCGRDLSSWRMALSQDGNPVMVGLHYGVALLPLPHYRAKHFALQLTSVDEQATIDVLHCADCEIKAEDGEQLVACYLGGLWDAHAHAERWAEQIELKFEKLSPDRMATYFSRWSRAEPIGPIHRTASEDSEPPWRS